MKEGLPTREEIITILQRLKDPETEESLFDLALVRHIDYREQDGTLVINIDFKGRMPSCPGCVPIAWLVQKGITDALVVEFLRYPAIKRVEFIDEERR